MAWALMPFDLNSNFNDILAARDYWIPTHRLPGFRIHQLFGMLMCMVFARSFAMTVNRLADRRLDAANPRTASRHLPAGILSVSQVSAFAVACAIAFVVSTLWFLP